MVALVNVKEVKKVALVCLLAVRHRGATITALVWHVTVLIHRTGASVDTRQQLACAPPTQPTPLIFVGTELLRASHAADPLQEATECVDGWAQ